MTENKIKKVVIFAGGKGTRMSELTEELPKPLVTVGGEPILVHIMRHFYSQGYKEFIIATGYKGDYFKKYFRDYLFLGRNVTFTKDEMSIDFDCNEKEDWTVHIVDTGEEAETAQRLHRVREYIGKEDFFLTYGDSMSDVNLHEVEEVHFRKKDEGKLATITAIAKGEKFGILDLAEDNNVTKFREKAVSKKQYINGGFIACSNELLDEVSENSGDFSFETLSNLSDQGRLSYYIHEGFWRAMDSKKDRDDMEKVFKESPELFHK